MRQLLCALMVCLGMSSPAWGSCGLEHCPIPQTLESDVAESKGDIQVRGRFTTFEFGGIRGAHSDVIVSANYRGIHRITLGAVLPLVYLTSNVSSGFGVSNPLVLGEWRGLNRENVSLAVGLQLELPVGFGHELVADRHWLALPYLRAHTMTGRVYTDLQVGYTQAFDFGHGGSPDHVHASTGFVDPHQEGELVYRGVVGVWSARLPFSPGLTVNGQQVVVGVEPNSFLYLGARFGIDLSNALSAFASFEVPLGNERYSSRTDLRFIHKL